MHNATRSTLLMASLALLGAFSSALAMAFDERSFNFQEDVSKSELVRLNISAGHVEIKGTADTNVKAVVTASCQEENQEPCSKVLKELAWSKKIGSISEFTLTPASITRYDHITVKVNIFVPRNKKLEVNLSAGELLIEGTNACLAADVGAGQIDIKLPQNQLASAKLSAKVGDVKLTNAKGETLEGERSMLVGANLEWKGTGKDIGKCSTTANVAAGAIQLTLN